MIKKSLIGLILLASLALAQEEALGPNGQPKPEPYSFQYAADSNGKLIINSSFLNDNNKEHHHLTLIICQCLRSLIFSQRVRRC